MKKNYIEENIKSAVGKITPDVYQAIHDQCSFEENPQTFPRPEDTGKRRQTFRHLPFAGMAAAALLACFLGIQWDSTLRTAATVAVDVNPSVSLELNKKNKVLRAQAQNQDGKAILGNMDLKGVDATVAINALVGSMVQAGYLNENENSVLVSIFGAKPEDEKELREQLLHSVRNVFSETLFKGAVIGQSLPKENPEITALALEYQVSAGKAALAHELVSHSTSLQVGDVMNLSVNDISLLLSSGAYHLPDVCVQGTASSNAYIGEEEVLQLAWDVSGFSPDQVEYTDVTMCYSNGYVGYEVEFYHEKMKYEYDFDATTGELLEWENEWKNPELFAIEMEELSRSKEIEGIGAEKALEAAYRHSGVDREEVVYGEAVPTYENGMEFYDVDFYTREYQYEYHIDALSGTVIEYTHNTKFY